MPVARGELAAMLEEEDLKDAILLVFANKQDQKGAMNAGQISDALGLPEVRNRQWSIQETSALKGKGLFEGFDWLVTCIKGTEEWLCSWWEIKNNCKCAASLTSFSFRSESTCSRLHHISLGLFNHLA